MENRIKGKKFTVSTLLNGSDTPDPAYKTLTDDPGCDVAVCRLAPQDYHRFHSPVDGTLVSLKNIHGECITIVPQPTLTAYPSAGELYS